MKSTDHSATTSHMTSSNTVTSKLEAITPNKMNPGSVNAAVVSCSEKDKYIRITTSGKLKAWVSYSLHFLEVQRLNGALVSIPKADSRLSLHRMRERKSL